VASRSRPALTRQLATVAAAVTAAGTLALAAPAAHADVAHVRHQITSAKQQLDQLQSSAETAAEQLNGARIKLADAQRKADSAQQDLAHARARVAKLRKQVAAFAAAAYTGQTMSGVQLMTSGSPEHWLDKMSTIDVVARHQASTMAALRSAHQQEQRARAAAQRALDTQRNITSKLKAKRQDLVANAKHQEKVIGQLEVKEKKLVKQARERKAREAARRRAAKLAAQRKAAAAAARQAARMAVSAAPEHTTSLASTSSHHSHHSSPSHHSHHSVASHSHHSVASHHSHHSVASHPHRSHAPAPPPSGNAASVAVQWAHRELGKPYAWGAAGPSSFDCSGLTMYVYGKAGVSLPHYTGAQYNSGPHVSRSQLQPGDLVFFGSDLHHVGIYIGGGNMIEAPHTGANVRIAPAFRSGYVGAVRPTG
jgi:cell wall-associated NlpC family hydrolase